MTRRFRTNDEVLVIADDSDWKGQWGHVIRFEEVFETYFVVLPDVDPLKHFAFREDELDILSDLEESEDEYETEAEAEDDTFEVPALGMSPEAVAAYLEFFIGRSLDKVGTVGPEHVFFGFQEFEGMTPHEVINSLLGKLEETAALVAQTHILMARIGSALLQIQAEDE